MSSAARPRFFYGYVIVAATFITLVLTHGVRYSFGVFFKPMSEDFGWTRAMTSGAFSLSWIVEGFVSIAVGHFNDRFGPRVMLTILGFFAGMTYLLMSLTGSLWQLYLFFGVVGGIGGAVFTPLVSTIARWFSAKRSMMTGFAIAGIGIGSMVGPLIADRLIVAFSWQTAYAVLGVAVLLIVILAAQTLKRDPAKMGQVAYGDDQASRMKAGPASRNYTLPEAIRTRQFWLFSSMMFCLGFAFFAIQVHIVPYATDLGLSPATAAAILATIGGSSIVGRAALGMIGDRIGNKNAFILGFVLMILATLVLLATKQTWGLYFFAIVFGLGYGNSATQESPLGAELFGLKSHGLIFAAASVGFTVGAALGPFASGFIFDLSKSYYAALIACAAVAAVGFVLNAILPGKGSRPA